MGVSLFLFGSQVHAFRAIQRWVGWLLASCLLALMVLFAAPGCQTVRSDHIAQERAFVDFTGLGPLTNITGLNASGAVPQAWDPLPLKQTPLYTHEQWRSPTLTTGVGLAYIHLPLPVPASAVLWFAQREYTAQKNDGRSLGRWTDEVGRQWFAAENNRFYVRGYVVTRGMEAWIVYCGYRRANAPHPYELTLAIRSLQTIVPGGTMPPKDQVSVASAANR
jgi:hypothetical protein